MTELSAQRVIETPIGRIALGASTRGLALVEILVNGYKKEFVADGQAGEICDRAAAQLAEYFADGRQEFDLPLDLVGTEFQKSVWQQISKIGFGEQVSYAELARRIGNPLASRAVGGAVGANPVPLVIGCHRVLGADNRITGYSGGEGLKTKRWLLDHEGIGFKDD